MSVVDEDTELRDLLVQTLDKNGVLGKIKAELRASIFLALEAQDQVKNPSSIANAKLKSFVQKPEGQTCIDLIHEFLDFFSLDYSNAVFSPETNTTASYKSPENLRQRLQLEGDDETNDLPVLASMVKNKSVSSPASFQANLTSNQLAGARQLFSANLNRGFDYISAPSAVHVLSSLCPKFPLFLIERFVDEESKSHITGFTLPVFIAIYEKLYQMCHSVVSDASNFVDDNTRENDQPLMQDKTEEQFLKQTIGVPEKRSDPLINMSGSSPEPTPVSPYGHFFDDDYYSKPKDSPVKFSEAKPISSMKLPSLNDSSKPLSNPSASEASDKPDWSSKNKSLEYDKRQSSYEDDFNTSSQASISEDLQGDSLLNSVHSSIGELTEDQTLSEMSLRADYIEEVKK